MELNKIDETVTQLLGEVLQIPSAQITDELAMNEVETWDSLTHMQLIASLETSINTLLTFEEIIAMKNVRAIKQIVRAKLTN
jgi:acyl carrier protein